MTLNDSMLNVFCLVDDQLTALHLDQVRQRGFAPRLHDSHTVAAWVNVSQGHRPLDFASLVTE
jgi:hypothetical protein